MNFREIKEKNTLSEQIAELQAAVLDLILVIGEPGWKFIKRHPRLLWLWNKSQPLIWGIEKCLNGIGTIAIGLLLVGSGIIRG